MYFRKFLAAVLLVAFASAAPAMARPAATTAPATATWSPESVARQIERSANTTSFAQLEDFGRAALKRTGRDRLDRLNHVA